MEACGISDGPGTVAVALDGSAAASKTLAIARRLADQLGARLTLLHLATRGEPTPALAGSRSRYHIADDRDVPLRHGRPIAALLAAASDPAMLLIAFPAGRDACQPDSTLSRVIQKAAGPLLLVPHAVNAALWRGLGRLLIPLDGAPSTFRALAPIVRLAARLGAALDLLYVADPAARPPEEPGTLALPVYLDQPQHAWGEWRGEVLYTLASYARLPSLPMPVQISAATGALGYALLRRAAAARPDAIVLVRDARFRPDRSLTFAALLDRAPCPILLAGTPREPCSSAGHPLRRYRPA